MFNFFLLMMCFLVSFAYASDEDNPVNPVLNLQAMTHAQKLSLIFDDSVIAEEEKDEYCFSCALERAFRLDEKVNHIFMSESSNLFPFLKYLALERVEPGIDPRLNTDQRFEAIREGLFKATGYLTFRKIYYDQKNVTASDLIFLSKKLEKIDIADDFSPGLKKYLNICQGIVSKCHDSHEDQLLCLSLEVKRKIGSYLNADDMIMAIKADQCFWFFKSENDLMPIVRPQINKFLNHFKQTVRVNYKVSGRFFGMMRSIITDLNYEYLLGRKNKGRLVDYLPNAEVPGVNEQLFAFIGNAADRLIDPVDVLFASVITTAMFENRINCAVSDNLDDQEDGGCVLM